MKVHIYPRHCHLARQNGRSDGTTCLFLWENVYIYLKYFHFLYITIDGLAIGCYNISILLQ